MNIENLKTEEELKDIILKKQLEWIKLCQDKFFRFLLSLSGKILFTVKQRTQRNMGTIKS